jgi:hypothetical protein
MISLCVFVAWACAFWAHERLQPRTCKLFPLAQSRRKAYQLLRFCGPVLALFLCLYRDFEKGLLYWFGLGALAGLAISILVAILKHTQSRLP